MHDFVIPELGKVVPYGVYDIAANAGWVNVGMDPDTAAFAVESIRRWWHGLGQARYPNATRLLITADCGGSNGVRVRLWKRELQLLADEIGWPSRSAICRPAPASGTGSSTVCSPSSHRTGAASRWSAIRSSSQLIGATTTETGLTVPCRIDANSYPKGIKVSAAEMDALNITRDPFHGEWNYTISPNQQPP